MYTSKRAYVCIFTDVCACMHRTDHYIYKTNIYVKIRKQHLHLSLCTCCVRLNMFIKCTCICVDVNVCMCTCICVYVNNCKSVYVFVLRFGTYVRMYGCMYECIHTCSCNHV